MNSTRAARTCSVCGTELTGKRYHRDRQGQYFCRLCHDQSVRKCTVCGAEVQRRDCHRNRHGEYVCRKCQRSNTYRHWIQAGFSHLSRAAIYLFAVAATLVVFWKILGWVAQP